MKNIIDLSIIIVSYNTAKLTQVCLATVYGSLRQSELNCEVIVVDNASTDGSVAMVTNKFPKTRLIKNKSNVGFGKANNQGAKLARGATLLFLNSDIEVIEDGISKLFTFFQSLDPKSVVGGKLFNPDMTPQSSCGPRYSLFNIFVALFLKGDHLHITRYSPNQIKRVDWIMGACMMMKKDLFWSVGGFDEGIFMYMEEIDLQYRLQRQGATIYFYPDTHFIHQGAGSSQGRASPILNVFRGFTYFYNKHGNNMQKILLRYILLLKSFSAIILFSILGKKYDRDIYLGTLKLLNNTYEN